MFKIVTLADDIKKLRDKPTLLVRRNNYTPVKKITPIMTALKSFSRNERSLSRYTDFSRDAF